MEKTRLKIEIGNKKNIFFISKHNASQCCDKLLNAYNNHYRIKHYISWFNLDKYVMNLINIITTCIILKSTTIIDILSISENAEYSKCQIENLEFFIHIIFANPLILKNWMFDESKWKPLFILYKIILSHQHVMNPKFFNLACLISETQKYWKMEHLLFLIDINFTKALCHAIVKAHYKERYIEQAFRKIAISITHNFYIITHQVKENEFWFDEFKEMMDITLFRQRCRINNRVRYQITHRHHKNEFRVRYLSFAYDYHRMRYMDCVPRTFLPLRNRIFKACAYYNCKVVRTNTNKIKMKICKGCKLTYYCSRKCQKCDWNSKHRRECQRLYVRANLHAK